MDDSRTHITAPDFSDFEKWFNDSALLDVLTSYIRKQEHENLWASAIRAFLGTSTAVDLHPILSETLSSCEKKPVATMAQMKEFENSEEVTNALYILALFGRSVEKTDSPRSRISQSRRSILKQAFEGSFFGDGAKLFLQALDDYETLYRPTQYYGRSIPLVQSSGTGKSRLVKEVSKTVPTLSICFRKSYLPEEGWPPRDVAPSIFMEGTEHFGEVMAAAFMGGLMQVVCEELAPISPSGKADYYLQNWSIAEERRERSFEKAMAAARSLITRANSIPVPSPRKGDNAPGNKTSQRQVVWCRGLFDAVCKEPAKELAQALRERGFKRFIFAFDECSFLNTRDSAFQQSFSPLRGMALFSLLRMIKAQDDFMIPGFTFWYLFLDTNLATVDFFPSQTNLSSARLVRLDPLPAWLYTGFDIFKPKIMVTTPSDALNFSWLKQYGRPYWNTQDDITVLRSAITKLYSGSEMSPTATNHVLATFSHRIGIELGTSEAANIIAIEGVRSHMRILLGIQNAASAITTTASEPMLSVAAIHELQKHPGTYRQALTRLTHQLILKGLVMDRGRLGELINRLLFILALDSANPQLIDNTRLRPTLLKDWFISLLGPKLGLPRSSSSLRRQFFQQIESAYINFTHFVELRKQVDIVSPDFLYELWCRGAAIQCTVNQPVIDGLFVVYHGNLDLAFDPANLSYVAWQTKAKVDPAQTILVSQLAGPRIFGRGLSWKPRSGIVMFMDIGTEVPFKKYPDSPCRLEYKPAMHPKGSLIGSSKWRGYMERESDEPARWCFNVRGNSDGTFPVIEPYNGEFLALFKQIPSYTARDLEKYAEWMVNAVHPLEGRHPGNGAEGDGDGDENEDGDDDHSGNHSDSDVSMDDVRT